MTLAPKIPLAAMASIGLGAAVAAARGPLAPAWLALTVFGVLAIALGKHASEAVLDGDTRDRTVRIACAGYLAGVAAGLAIAALREPRVLWVGLVGVALAYFHRASPVRLADRGLGEVAEAALYGPLVACGTFLVQRGTVTPFVVWLSLPLGLLAVGVVRETGLRVGALPRS